VGASQLILWGDGGKLVLDRAALVAPDGDDETPRLGRGQYPDLGFVLFIIAFACLLATLILRQSAS
jgi:hypothetical protein